MRVVRWMLLVSLIMSLGLVWAPGILAEGRLPIVRFEGTIAERPTEGTVGTWTIVDRVTGEEKIVTVAEGTSLLEVAGEAVVGAPVIVVAKQLEDGAFEALLICTLSSEEPERVVHFRGVVTDIADDGAYIVVNRLTIYKNAETVVEGGELVEGVHVKVEAHVVEGRLTAIKIEILTDEDRRTVLFQGTVMNIVGDLWTINEGGEDGTPREVTVNERTVLRGSPDVGDTVKVYALRAADGKLTALLIGVIDPEPEPSPEATPQEIQFSGVIQKFPPHLRGSWVIGGRLFVANQSTVVNGTPQIGLQADVRATRRGNGVWHAVQIDIAQGPETRQFTGTIRRLPRGRIGLWIIDEWQVMVMPSTQVIGNPVVGAQATVSYIQARNAARKGRGAVVATRIEISGGPTPTLTPTEGPILEPTIPAPTIQAVQLKKSQPAVEVKPQAQPTREPAKAPKSNGRKSK